MTSVNPLNAIFDTALLTRVPRASWLVREGDRALAAHQEERFYSGASMIKTFLLAAALDLVEGGEARVDQPIAVLPSHEAGGDGVLRLLTRPMRLPLRDLLGLMTALSDNTATNAVLEAVGLEAEHDRLLSQIAGRGLLPTLGSLALQLLEEQQDRRALARWLGEEVRFAHKTGTIGGVRHDAGVLRVADREIRVSVFTDGGPVDSVLRAPDVWGSLSDPESELRFWRDVLDGSDRWGKAVVHHGRLAGLVGLYGGRSPEGVSIGVHVHEGGAHRREVAQAAARLAAEAAGARGLRVVSASMGP